MTLCRCGEISTKVCHLCKTELCDFHAGGKAVATQFEGFTRLRLEPVCFPNCTSSFGRAEDVPSPRASA